MTTLKTTNRTFNKTVKRLIAQNLKKVVSFKKSRQQMCSFNWKRW